jgi:RNA polymerase sigma factor for flagellar operon FliA
MTPADRDRYTLQFMPLVCKLANRLSGKNILVEAEDLIHEGMIGLIEALDTYDPAMGIKVLTWVYPRIHGAMIDAIRRWRFVPWPRAAEIRQMQLLRGRIQAETGRQATEDEIAAGLGVSDMVLNRLLDAERVSRRMPSLPPGNLVRDEAMREPAEIAERAEVIRRMFWRFLLLPARQRRVIALLYIEGLSLVEAGKRLGVTDSRISQIHREAIGELRKRMEK